MTPTPTLLSKSPAQLTGKPMTAPAATAASTAFVQNPKPVKAQRVPKTLEDSSADYFKIMAFGHVSTGKTFIITSLLLAGQDVLVASTDTGGHGLSSVKQALKDMKREDLLSRCHYFELDTYDDVEDFVYSPQDFWPGIYDTDIDTIFFDGFSNFQQSQLDDKVMGFTPQTNAGDAREAGLWAGQQDWGAIKKGTLKIHNKFLQMKNEKTGKTYHKILTCLESKPKEDKTTGENKIAPMLQGAAAGLIEPAYDLIFRTRRKKVTEGGKAVMEYYYEMEGTDSKVMTKSRGLKVDPKMPGDFKALWSSICAQRGIPEGKR